MMLSQRAAVACVTMFRLMASLAISSINGVSMASRARLVAPAQARLRKSCNRGVQVFSVPFAKNSVEESGLQHNEATPAARDPHMTEKPSAIITVWLTMFFIATYRDGVRRAIPRDGD